MKNSNQVLIVTMHEKWQHVKWAAKATQGDVTRASFKVADTDIQREFCLTDVDHTDLRSKVARDDAADIDDFLRS